MHLSVLEQDMFCGRSGDRTVLVINLTQKRGREIDTYSVLPEEKEVLLPPGTTLKVRCSFDAGNGLCMVQLDEIEMTDKGLIKLWTSFGPEFEDDEVRELN